MNSSSTVSAELGISLFVPPEDVVVPLVAGLSYSKTDPYAVCLSLHVGLDEPVEWVFARELLLAGLEREHGLGDVRVWPSVRSQGGLPGMVLNIELSSSAGHANFEAPLREVSAFLHDSYALVPAGRENRHIDVDAEFRKLLRQS
ncbi:MAG: SsgA family sporulation/cell division regulator [Streptosporangiales bacterium]|nr:SsgA family sporulation/cell division regulator [Streptosporangiales bacterium]